MPEEEDRGIEEKEVPGIPVKEEKEDAEYVDDYDPEIEE